MGAGATSNLLAVYFGAARQMHDFRTLQDHRAPKTTSDLLFKGAVAGAAHSVYSGLIRVEKGARGTNAFQTNRNLVLAEGARADSVPNLEIEENELRCSHASAVGPIDEEQRYYLESRGVPPEVAGRPRMRWSPGISPRACRRARHSRGLCRAQDRPRYEERRR